MRATQVVLPTSARIGSAATETIWDIIGWSVGALAALTLILALLGDAVRRRFRSVRRCPKCWYDLSHTPGMTCSECGYTARRERQLFKSRRHKRWVVVAMMLWIGSYFAFRTPDMQQRGWVAAIPTTALIFLWQQERVDWFGAQILADKRAAGSWRSTADIPISAELLERIDHDDLIWPHWRLLIETAIHESERSTLRTDDTSLTALHNALLLRAAKRGYIENPALLRRVLSAGAMVVTTRPKWPLGTPIRACVSAAPVLTPLDYRYTRAVHATAQSSNTALYSIYFDSLSDLFRMTDVTGGGLSDPSDWTWWDMTRILGQPSAECESLEYSVHLVRPLTAEQAKILGTDVLVIDRRITVDSRVGGTIDDILVPQPSPEFDKALTTRLKATWQNERVRLSLADVADAFNLLRGATFAVTLEIVDGGHVIARGAAWWCAVSPGGSGIAPDIRPDYELVEMPRVNSELPGGMSRQYLLRITPNPEMALRRFESDRYWSGLIEVPVMLEAERAKQWP